MRRIKVRFNLGRGENYLKWKVDKPIGKNQYETSYYDPKMFQLTMINCTLKNNKTTAVKIFEGADKSVCAWVLCEDIVINPINSFVKTKTISKRFKEVSYNPRLVPNWVFLGEDADGYQFQLIHSNNRKLLAYDK